MPPHSNTEGRNLGSWMNSDMLCSHISLGDGYEYFHGKNDDSPSRNKKRTVRFFSTVQIVYIPSRNDFTKDELKAFYITKEEMNEIHLAAWRIVEAMNSGVDYEERDDFSKRGLVDLVEDNVQRRRRNRHQAYRTVFGLQEFQSEFNQMRCIESKEVMAQLYHDCTATARRTAYLLAIQDALVAYTG